MTSFFYILCDMLQSQDLTIQAFCYICAISLTNKVQNRGNGFGRSTKVKELEQYLTYLKASGTNKDTFRQKKRHLEMFFASITKPIDLITIDDICVFINSLNKSPACLWTYKKNLKAFFKWCNVSGFTKLNLDLIKNPKVRMSVPTFVTEEEYKTILQNSSAKYGAIFGLLHDTGIRVGELVRIKMIDTVSNPHRITLIGEKTNQIRTCYFSSACPLKKFTMSGNAVRQALYNACHKAGIRKIHPHEFRHAFALRGLRSGLNIRELQMLLGHTSLDTTAEYLQLLDSDIESAYKQMNKKQIIKLSSTIAIKNKYRFNFTLDKF